METYQDAVLYRPGRCPVEHPSAVVLHLGGHEVEVPGLIVSDANIEPPVTSSITGTVGWPEVTVIDEVNSAK